ncbi:unnamed protein product [Cochlearia groenlandica]
MVWFQCEDCGEELKKPKLPNHFRMCRALKLSCIDCGETFGRDTVQGHTQCITEAEKYGPKGQSKTHNGKPGKPKDNSKQQPDFDINVGLSNRYPWFCSLCNTSATSQQTLLSHADGKKHRGKARGFHAKQQESEQSTVEKKDANENASNGDLEQKREDDATPVALGVANGDSTVENKKKKNDDANENASNDEVVEAEESKGSEVKNAKKKKRKVETLGEVVEAEETKGSEVEKAKKQEDHEKKIKWKKLITSALKSNKEDNTLKMKKLKKLMRQSVVHSGVMVFNTTKDKTEFYKELELKVNSSSRFAVDGKNVKLVAKE